MEALLCPICRRLLLPPIWQCSSSHPLCDQCSRSIMICPVCHSDLKTRERCLRLEQLSRSQSNLECRNGKNKGCPFIGSVDEVRNHELNCYYDEPEFACLMQGQCKWMGRAVTFPRHLMDMHDLKAPAVVSGVLGIELFTSASDVQEWKQHSWNALYQRDIESVSRIYWLSAVCTDFTLHISIISLSAFSEPIKVCVKSPDGQMQLFLGMTQLPNDPAQPHFTISLKQLTSFSQTSDKQISDSSGQQSTSVSVSVYFASPAYYAVPRV